MSARRLAIAPVALALLVSVAAAPGAAALGGPDDTRTAITVDCAIGEGSNDNHTLLPGDTLTVTLLNCSDWTVTDLDGLNSITVPGEISNTSSYTVPSATPSLIFTVSGDADLEVFFEGDDIDIDVSVATPGATPTGELISTNRLTMPIAIDTFAIALDQIDGPSNDTLLAGNTECELEVGYHPFQTLPITISQTGDFTFRVIDVTPVDEDIQWGQPYYPSQDFFLAVYTSFDPANPEANLVSCNDDRPDDDVSFVNGGVTYISDDQAPEFVSSLTPGAYTLVLTTNRSSSSEEWAAGQFSPWSGVSDITWTPTPMSALFELWGPAGSITVGDGDTEGEPEPEAQLADTGADDAATTGIIAVAALAMMVGTLLVAIRRRSTTRA